MRRKGGNGHNILPGEGERSLHKKEKGTSREDRIKLFKKKFT